MNRRQRKRRHARRRAHEPEPDRPRNVISRESYSAVRRGHIVPRTYQLNFAIGGKVAVHVPGRSDCVQMDIREAGTRRRFYRRTRPDGTGIDDIEAMLGVMEDRAGPVLKEVAGGASLTDQRKSVLMQFLAVQMLRGPAFFSKHHADIDRLVPDVLTSAEVKPALLERTGGDLQVARQQVVAMFRDPTRSLLRMIQLSMKASAALGSMRWQLLHFREPLLAYSDQPVVVWPLGVAAFPASPRQPSFAPLAALEVRVPLAPQTAALMTWADEPDEQEPVEAGALHAAETNALVIAQADKQWMHRLGSEPPVAQGSIQPLSREFEHRYTADAARTSRRREATRQYLHRVRNRRYLNDIEVVKIRRSSG